MLRTSVELDGLLSPFSVDILWWRKGPNGKTHHRVANRHWISYKITFNDFACCLRVLPTCLLLPDLTQNISFFPLFFPLFLSVCLAFSALFSVCLGLCFSLQKSVLQQLDSSGWRQFVCAGRSPHSPSGPQLHQPHHRGSFQRPQGLAYPVSKAASTAITKPQTTTSDPLITVLPLLKLRLRSATWEQWRLRCLILVLSLVIFDISV